MKWFQNFRFNKSKYERPQDEWVCGHSPEGFRCPLGPNKEGKCITKGECMPAKKGDRWLCTRSEENGGKCENGPLSDGCCGCPVSSCQPLLGMRAKRGRIVFTMIALSLGLIFLAFASRAGKKTAMPGPLSKGHAPLQQNCEACHSGAKGDATDWLKAAVSSESHPTQNQNCLACHHNLNQPSFQLAHSLPGKELKSRTDRMPQGGSQAVAQVKSLFHASVPTNSQGEIACSTCHREHQGTDVPLNVLSSSQCQTCHQQVFSGFSKGHPPFERSTLAQEEVLDWETWVRNLQDSKSQKILQELPPTISAKLDPLTVSENPEVQSELIRATNRYLSKSAEPGTPAGIKARKELQGEFPDDLSPGFFYASHKRSSIAFNHQSHLMGYFQSTKSSVATACTDCHQPDTQSHQMSFVGFQQACSSCHTKMITSGGDAKSGVALLRVPALDVTTMRRKNRKIGSYPSNAEGELPVFTKLLVAGDLEYPEFSSDLKTLRLMESWGDLSSATDLQLQALERVTLGVKRLYAEIALKGKEGLRVRLEKSTRGRLTPDTIDYLLRPLPVDVMKGIQSRALPRVVDEVSSKGSHPTHEMFENTDTVDYSLLYQPKKHTDNYLQTWLTAVSLSPVANEIFESTPGQHSSFSSCIICHSVGRTPSGEATIYWRSTPYPPGTRGFNKFSHRPHTTMQCNGCHSLQDSVDGTRFKNAYHRTNPASLEPVFKPISKESCLRCHTPSVAGDRCLTCHQYHIGQYEQRVMKTPISPKNTALNP